MLHDPSPDKEPEGKERWWIAACLLGAFAFLIAIVAEDYEPKRLAPLFMALSWFPLIALHEGGHAAVARLVGMRVESIVIGFGSTVWSFRAFGVPISVKTYPLGGSMLPSPAPLKRARLRSALVYLAGPMAELSWVGLMALLVGPSVFLLESEHIPTIAAQASALSALLGVIFNLWPRSLQTGRGGGVSDGLGALQSLLRPTEQYERRLLDYHEARIYAATRKDLKATLDRCEEAYTDLPRQSHLRALIFNSLERVAREHRQLESLEGAMEGRNLPRRP